MSTFSSVSRKPAQNLKPKVAPRRNVQRHAQKIAAAATLTPESLSQSPDLQPTRLNPNVPSSRDPSSGQPALTPPATALEKLSPPAPPSPENVVTSTSVPSQSERRSASREAPSGIPQAITPETPAQAGTKRRAEVLDDAFTSLDTRNERHSNHTAATRIVASSAPASKRRKVAPQAAPSYLLSRPAEAVTRAQTKTPADRQNTSTAGERARASTEDLLHQATAQFGSVSKIADSIENRTRNLRPRTARASTSTTYLEVEDDDNSQPRRRKQRPSRTAAIEQAATVVVDQIVRRGRKRNRRGSTPEDPENHEIDINTVTMNHLTKDSGLGRRSATGIELANNWKEIRERWKEGPEENRKRAEEKTQAEKEARKERAKEPTANPETNNQNVTGQGMILNGTIVRDPDTMAVDFSNNLEQRVIEHQDNVREVRKVDNYVNSARIGKHAGLRANGSRWDDEATEMFYKGLRMFGTDFEMISSLFPSKRRKEIKDKYTREERDNWEKVKHNLNNPQPIQLDAYTEMVGLDDGELKDPRELEAEFARENEEFEKRKKQMQEGLIPDAADIPIPSTEVDAEGNLIANENVEGTPVDERTRRIRSEARRVVEQAVAPKKTRQRRTRDTSKVTAKSKKGKPTLAGVEERIGNIDEVEL